MENIFIIDFETTGLNPYLNDIIEVAIKKINEEDKTFYEQCIMMDDSTEDKSIKFVRSLIGLDSIIRE